MSSKCIQKKTGFINFTAAIFTRLLVTLAILMFECKINKFIGGLGWKALTGLSFKLDR